MPLSCLLEQNLGSQCYTYQSTWIKVSFPEMKTKHAFHTPRYLWCPYVYVFALHMAKNKFQASKSSKVSFLSNLYLQYIWHFEWSFSGIKTWTYTMALQNSKKKKSNEKWTRGHSFQLGVVICNSGSRARSLTSPKRPSLRRLNWYRETTKICVKSPYCYRYGIYWI